MGARRRRERATMAGVTVASLLLGWCANARAHSAGLSVGDYAWRGRSLAVDLAFARADLDASWPRALTGDGSWVTLLAHEPAAQAWVRERLRVHRDGQPCESSEGAMRLDGDGVTFQLVYACPAAVGELAIEAAFVREFGPRHRHLAQLRLSDRQIDRVLTEHEASMIIALDEHAPRLWWAFGAALALASALAWIARRARARSRR